MTSQEQVFDPNKLTKLIAKHWTEFIDTRKLLNFIKFNIENKLKINNPKIQTLTVSYCEIKPQGISVWISYNIINSSDAVNFTDEILLKKDGNIEIIKSDYI